MNRSLRRHHNERIMKKMDREDYYTLSAFMGKGNTETNAERDRRKAYKKLHNHRKHCSCFMCGNPRRQKLSRKERLTIQELKADERAAQRYAVGTGTWTVREETCKDGAHRGYNTTLTFSNTVLPK